MCKQAYVCLSVRVYNKKLSGSTNCEGQMWDF